MTHADRRRLGPGRRTDGNARPGPRFVVASAGGRYLL